MTHPPRPAAFAIPGDINQRTGGFIYERLLLGALRDAGRDVAHLVLPPGFPDPTPAEMDAAISAMAGIPRDRPLIIDGLVFGSLHPRAFDEIRAPVVAMIHHPLGLETGLSRDRADFLLAREAENLSHVHHVVVPSPHTAEVLARRFDVPEEKITVAPPGFPSPDPVRMPQEPPLILSVGLLAERKGHDILLDALSHLTDLDWTAEIVGRTHDTAYAARLLEQRDRLGLTPLVAFLGEVDDKMLRQRYRAATVFALATRYEGYGIVLGEAMLHGLPVVSCRVGAVPQTLTPGAALLVSADDARAFSDALRIVLTNERARADMAAASARGGAALPRWSDTAAIMGNVLDVVGN